ncbi:MAG: hypothetical protein H5T86_04265, partial [Armatimonadetes bacterium]|nr:hypothetical protein [Armatimonadota bacterium]
MKERHVLDHGCLSSQLRRCRAAHGRCRPLPGTESFPDVLLVFLAVAIATAFSFADEQAAVGGPFVSINGKPWTPERPPIRMSGVILVPAREFATAVGATLSWDQQAKMVTVTREGASFQAWAGQNVA